LKTSAAGAEEAKSDNVARLSWLETGATCE
jgi:hypothetical protein